MAGYMAYQNNKITLEPGESKDITTSYGLIVFSDPTTATAYVGFLTGSSLNDIFKPEYSKVVATASKTWGNATITNNSTSKVTINVVVLT